MSEFKTELKFGFLMKNCIRLMMDNTQNKKEITQMKPHSSEINHTHTKNRMDKTRQINHMEKLL